MPAHNHHIPSHIVRAQVTLACISATIPAGGPVTTKNGFYFKVAQRWCNIQQQRPYSTYIQMYPTKYCSLTLTAQLDPVKGHPHLCVCVCRSYELSTGQRSGAVRQHQGG